jgi:hypothetical protein
MIDIGTQHGEWQGKEKIRRQCIIIWELADSMYDGDDGEPHRRHFSQFYTQSLDARAKLRKHLTGWRGRDFTKEELQGFDPQNILGKPCRLIIGTNDTGKNIVDSISRYKGDNIEPEGDIHWFSFDEFEGSFPEWMSDGIRGLCEKSDEYQSYISGDQKNDYEEMPAPEEEDLEDSIPF